jgi:hypothetical protein
MTLDEMMDAWRAQDQAPLYGVNRDLLQLVLQHEQTDLRRALRREQWTAYVLGPAMAAFGSFWLWVAVHRREPIAYAVAAGIAVGALVAWVGALWLSRRRQARRERGFGNSLQAEIMRNLSLVEYQLSTGGRWSAALLWSAPPVVGAALIYWLLAEINDNTPAWYDTWMLVVLLGSALWTAYAGSRAARKRLEPRRQRLRDLLDTLNAAE